MEARMARTSGSSDTAKDVYRAATAAMGGTARVMTHANDDELVKVDVLTCSGAPKVDCASFSTLTLHKSHHVVAGSNVPVEICMVVAKPPEDIGNLLTTAALFIIKNGWVATPETVFNDLLTEYKLSKHLSHLLFVTPFEFPELGAVVISRKLSVHWLQAIPISNAERDYMGQHGYAALADLLEEENIPYFDLTRKSAC
jgi:hypothetical protein